MQTMQLSKLIFLLYSDLSYNFCQILELHVNFSHFSTKSQTYITKWS